MRLISVGVLNFRSIGAEPVMVDLTKKVNVLIGANNSGKSNVIKALQWLSASLHASRVSIEQIDQHNQASSNAPGVRVSLKPEENDQSGLGTDKELPFTVTLVDRKFACTHNAFEQMNWRQFGPIMLKVLSWSPSVEPSNEDRDQRKAEVGERLAIGSLSQLPEVLVVPQFRQIRDGQYSIAGAGVIGLLASWQRPGPGNQGEMKRFAVIQELVRGLLHLPNLELDVDHEKKHIMLTNNGLRLPLESYGTGIHELIILAIAIYSKDNVLFCIEEPEIHLHPRLQKEFLNFIVKETKNRYLVTTHSSAFLAPSEDVRITHLRLVDGATKSWPVEATQQALAVLDDLGAKAADILQANSVIWVEGPSDRIYINRWLDLLEPGLREGIDYSIMFYGGRLLAHLSLERDSLGSADDQEIDSLIRLLRLNQHSMIVVDSDRKSETDGLNATKKRVLEECAKNGVPCLVTWGREIENYLTARSVAQAYESKLGGKPASFALGQYEPLEDSLKRACGEAWRPTWSYDDAKPEWAGRIACHIEEGDITPALRGDLSVLTEAIKRANQ